MIMKVLRQRGIICGSLMGSNGWFLRNEVVSQLPHCNSQIYLGWDVGSVYGKGREVYNGHTLGGVALGIRGRMGRNISYDVFAAMPVIKPDGFRYSQLTGGGWMSLAF